MEWKRRVGPIESLALQLSGKRIAWKHENGRIEEWRMIKAKYMANAGKVLRERRYVFRSSL